LAVYSIKDIEKLCGIKAHTIRVWEQRYGLVEPKRTKSNIRYYEDEDLKFLLNVALLNKNGFKISKIAKMSDEEILDQVRSISDLGAAYNTQLDALTISMIEMDEYKFDRIVSTNIRQIGFERTMIEVIYPFLEKLSVLWLTGSISPVQENFTTCLIGQKIISQIDQLPIPANGSGNTFLIYLPKGETQELSLLFMHYLLKVRGFKVVYLGQDISLGDLRDCQKIKQPDYLFTMISETFSEQSVEQYLEQLTALFPKTEFLLSGYQVIRQRIRPTTQLHITNSLQDTIQFLDQLNVPTHISSKA